MSLNVYIIILIPIIAHKFKDCYYDVYNCGRNRMLDENFFFPSRMHISKRNLKGMFTKVKFNMIQFRYCDLNKIVD